MADNEIFNGLDEGRARFGAKSAKHTTRIENMSDKMNQGDSAMSVGELCRKELIGLPPATPVNQLAEFMRENQMHAVLVVEMRDEGERPLGIITDSDLVGQIVAPNRDPQVLCARDVMSTDLVSLRSDATLWEAAELMREEGVRQVPVLDGKARLVGLLQLDDVLQVVTAELAELLDGMDGEMPRLI